MKILFTLLIILSTFSCFVKSQNAKFINFVPYQDSFCTGAPHGYGYSIAAPQVCIYDLGNGGSNAPLSYSVGWEEENSNSTIIYYTTYNNTDFACQNELEYYTFSNNSCNPSMMLPLPFNGTVVGAEYQFSLVSLTDEPVYAPNSLIFSQYSNPDFGVCDSSDIVFTTTISNGLKIVNGDYSNTYLCNKNTSYIESCINRVNCKLTNVTMSCDQPGNSQNQVNFC